MIEENFHKALETMIKFPTYYRKDPDVLDMYKLMFDVNCKFDLFCTFDENAFTLCTLQG